MKFNSNCSSRPGVSFKVLFLFCLIISLFFCGCSNSHKKLEGYWENDKKLLHFDSGIFTIYNKDSPEILAFRGSYTFAQNPDYVIKMKYEEFMDMSKGWYSLEGSELYNYVDNVLFNIDDDVLETKVIANGQLYYYKRVQIPIE